jgi:hypothetical protein
MELPICRHRGLELTPGRYQCHSPKLVVGPAGVDVGLCNACPYCDHAGDGGLIVKPAAAPRPGPCRHLGEPTGQREECSSCAGRVEIKLRACAVHGSCTTDRQVPSAAFCPGCRDYQPPPLDILITGGLGDFLALESHMPRERIRTIYYATRAEPLIRQLVAAGGFPALEREVSVYSDFGDWWDASKVFGFVDKAAVERAIGTRMNADPADPRGSAQSAFISVQLPTASPAEDWSIVPTFPRMIRGELPFRGSWYLQNQIADIAHLGLPEEYIVVQAYSPNDGRLPRDFSDLDWQWLLSRLDRAGQTAVVLGKGGGPVPEHPRILNLTDRTTVPESLEILKGAYGYIGIDSWLATPAAQLFDASRLLIRTRNLHLLLCRACYFAPHKEFDFLVTAFGGAQDVRALWPVLAATPSPQPSQNADKRGSGGSAPIGQIRVHPRSLLSIGVPEGIGDTLWAATKMQAILRYEREVFGRDFEGIHCKTVVPNPHGIVGRAHEFLKGFPWVAECGILPGTLHPAGGYDRDPAGYVYLPSGRVEGADLDYRLVPNHHLERGFPLESWLPEFATDWNVMGGYQGEPEAEAAALARARPYFVVYVGQPGFYDGRSPSMNRREPRWRLGDWDRVIGRLTEETGLACVVVGAPYDTAAGLLSAEVWQDCTGRFSMHGTVELLRHARLVVSYHCGIPIVSTFLGVPTVMAHPSGRMSPEIPVQFTPGFASCWLPPFARYRPFRFGVHGPDDVVSMCLDVLNPQGGRNDLAADGGSLVG